MAIVYNSLPPFHGGPPDFWSSLVQFPTKIMDQNFGQELKPADLKSPFVPGCYALPRTRECIDKTGFSRVFFEPDCFQIQFQTDQFKMEEVSVDFYRDSVVIFGETGFVKEGEGEVFRRFERKYLLPVDAKMGDDSCVSSKDGVITVRIPRVAKKIKAKEINI